jgi:HSP20 family protein
MDYNQSWVAKGHRGNTHHGDGQRRRHDRSNERAAVNIFKTGTSFEMLVFAPGRIKEHFHLEVKGNELSVSYTPPEGFARPEWVRREYSRGGFLRTFVLDESIDMPGIVAKYADGVLEVSLPVIPGKEAAQQEIPVL